METNLDGDRKSQEQEWWERMTINEETPALINVLRERYIHMQVGVDKLRWGYLPKGFFNTKEAYDIKIRGGEESEEIW